MRGGKSPERADSAIDDALERIDGSESGQTVLGRRELLRRIRADIATAGLPPEREELALRLAEDIVKGPVLSRRTLIKATAAGSAAVGLGALVPSRQQLETPILASATQPLSEPDPALAAATPSLTASVLRREDMLALKLEFYNLVRSGMNLVRQVSGDPAYIVATLGYGADHTPQNIAEEAFHEGSTESSPSTLPGDVDARVAGPTRLAFRIPATATSIPYQLTTILALLPQSKLNVVPAALPAGTTPMATPVLADPGPLETRIEAPWSLVLSPHGGATWSHATSPVTRNGRTELWHTRLSEHDATGRAVRAVWTNGFDTSSPPNPAIEDDPFLMSLTPNQRWQIVRLSSDFGIGGYSPRPIDANRLMLSALGAWLDSDGNWPEVESLSGFNLAEWRHIATMGRDQFVKTVELGYLLPFGHPAALVTITERKVNPVASGSLSAKPAAYLRKREFIIVRQPVVTYPDQSPQPDEGRQMPFGRVELRTLVTPNIDSKPPFAGFALAFFPIVGTDPFPFNVVGIDRDGRSTEFTMPLVFVDKLVLDADPANAPALVKAYNELDGADLEHRERDMSGQKVSFTENVTPGDSSVAVNKLTFGAVDPIADVGVGKAPFFPTWTAARVRLDAVEQIRGTSVGGGGVEIEPHLDFVTGGFDGNPAEVFAKLKDAVELTFSDGAGDRSGGVITPDMSIVNLSRTLGPQGGNGTDLPQKFKPEEFFKGAKLLGAIKLEDVLDELDFETDGVTFPTMKSRPIYDGDPTQPPRFMETTFQLKPQLKEDPTKTFTPKSDGSLTLDILYQTPVVPPGEPTWQIVGDLRRFTVTLIGADEDTRFIRLHFSRMTFTARNGGKPDITPYIDKVELDGPLKFVDSIKDYLKTPGTGPNIDVTPSQVSAGFTLQIPNIPAGAVTIINIAFSATLIIPFNGDPARARFAMSSREHPFLVTYLALGGGGFFAIEVALDGVKFFEMDIVAGVEAAIDLILVTAEVHYLFGCHLEIGADDRVGQISYIRIGGHCGVWGIWSVTLDLYLALDYDSETNELWGQAQFTIEIEYVFLSKTVSFDFERRIAGPAGASGIEDGATAALLAPASSGGSVMLASFSQPSDATAGAAAASSAPIGFASLVSQNDWNAYAAAFASNA
jgi:hypothetical protein